LGFAFDDGALYMLSDSGVIWVVSGVNGGLQDTTDAPVTWMCEFADIAEDSYVKKGISKLYFRIELDEDASCAVWLRYDSVGDWHNAGEYFAGVKRGYTIPVIPRRADHFRIRLTGSGGFRLFGLTREFYSGSPLRSVKGRQ
jgi:hypothetical protein